MGYFCQMFHHIQESADWLRKNGVAGAAVGIVLGTGLNRLGQLISVEKTIPYAEIPHFPLSTVTSHSGNLLYGTLEGQSVVAMQGRFHFYEGYSMEQVVFPIRVMKLLGVETLLLSNASGAINLDWKKGELMILEDHINLQPAHPLIGANLEQLGTRFPDMSEPYDHHLQQLLEDIAIENDLVIRKGTYVSVSGPNIETRAEYRFLRRLGADAVGMSTVPEVIASRHAGMRCAAISVLTDECDPDNLHPVALEDIIAVAEKADEKLAILFKNLIARL
jgi:purine-nucleoside phosphorylase